MLDTWSKQLMYWVETHPAILGWMGGLSLLMLLISLILIPMLIVRLPVDYLTACHRPKVVPAHWRWIYLAFKNICGSMLFLAGLAMLVLPGQGLLTLAVAVTLLDFPGKRRLIRRILIQPKVLATVNRLRKKAGKPPMSIGSPNAVFDPCFPVDPP